MKRIVVIGAKGGTGPSLVRVLQDEGYEVVRVDVQPWTPADGHGYVQLDVRDAEGVNDVFAGADGVVHFGSPPADAWMSTTEAFHQVAVAGFNVFQAARNVGIRRLVWASSIEVYGDLRRQPSLPVTESSPLAPPGIYGGSKVVLERLAQDYCRWHGMSIAGFRLGRIIYDNDFGRSRLQQLVEDPALGADCLWSYIDARDVGSACLAWLESDHQGAEVFNLVARGVHQPWKVAHLLQRHGYQHLPAPEFAAHETPFSSAKIRKVLGWQERYDWRDILSP